MRKQTQPQMDADYDFVAWAGFLKVERFPLSVSFSNTLVRL
jgi:hypothetical protein